ncbi:MAG: pilus assembly protein TadB, partial [Zymomonas sp.]|nr:pilus assembly protein TadB [Zymomonas sp.]
MPLMTVAMLGLGAFTILVMLVVVFAGPSPQRAKARRLKTVASRHNGSAGAVVEAQMRRITANRATRVDTAFASFLPNPALLQKRLAMTGKTWTVGHYGMATLGLFVVVAGLIWLQGAPPLLALGLGVVVGAGVPHLVVGFFI